jgi:hypothetical protein
MTRFNDDFFYIASSGWDAFSGRSMARRSATPGIEA